MTRETLYDLAFRYKKTKLWKRLLDTQIFAARTENGETIFICIMGILGEHISVAVYPENEFYSYYKFLDIESFSDDRLTTDHFEQYISSSCIQCSFENKDMLHSSELEEARAYARSHGIRFAGANAYPQFTRFIPYHAPWYVTKEGDLALLAAGLEASLALYAKLKTDPGRCRRSLFLPLLPRDIFRTAQSRFRAAAPIPSPGEISTMRCSFRRSVKRNREEASTAASPG